MKLLKRLTFALGILVGVVSIGMGAMSDDEWEKARYNCFENEDKDACQALIDNGLKSVEQCDKHSCGFVGSVYIQAGYYRSAIPYFEKAIVFGDNRVYTPLGYTYEKLQDYYNAKKYYEIGCSKINRNQSKACFNLGLIYDLGKGVQQDYHKSYELYKKSCDMKYGEACTSLGSLYGKGQGVRQDYHKAYELWEKACDMKNGLACNNLGRLYYEGQGVRQNFSTAKQYSGKACDLGEQMGCDNYRMLNEQGIQ